MKLETKVTPWLGFNNKAEEAARFYTSIIPHSSIHSITKKPGTSDALVVKFELGGLPVYALNSGQDWKFSTAFSFSVGCDDQEELDHLWAALSEGGQEFECGWVTDKFGLSWQIVPARLSTYLDPSTPERATRVLHAVWGMVKLDIASLEAAYSENE
ncbi:VOC family protein [Pelagicoccus sp. SDUM812002]|uniref:VOC family protein n=1 Tax=Pelagicoccus sp. SDUM812002 TaxID=3041266 RepID=UPI00280F5EE1|nr:VOC family protein [Pelagicoccus sp. SDUM812002]MDQ8184016.1 VOC family protein [Pelagicoccus sp. SDUM812002]